MNLDNYTNSAQDLIQHAAQIATQLQNPTLKTLHILSASLDNDFCKSFFRLLGLPLEPLQKLIEHGITKLPHVRGSQLSLDYETQDFLNQCQEEAQRMGDSFVSLEHLLLEFAVTKHLPADIHVFFKEYNFTPDRIKDQMHSLRGGKPVTDKGAEQQYQVLDKYCQNLTKQAEEGKLDPVIGRHEEIRRVLQILSRRTKNNPVLVGAPGVGKTAIVEGIAQRIINEDVPESLRNSKVYTLDLGLLIAGAKYQGEFEERLKSVLKAIQESKEKIILFIDELHMLIGAGRTGQGGMDASNLLKPALARGELHCIGATTLQEYKQYIEKDSALERRFQKVIVEEPSPEDALAILRGLKERYEIHHGIRIKDQALIKAVQLAHKYISDRFLPDKAIDLVDEAASLVKMAIDSKPEELDKLERKMRQLEVEKVALEKEKGKNSTQRLDEIKKELQALKEQHQTLLNQWKAEKEPLERMNKIKEDLERAHYEYELAERHGDFAKASEIKYGTITKLEKQLKLEQEKLQTLETHLIKEAVDEDDIATVLSRWTKIPVEKLKESEKEKLLNMDQILKERVIGQDDAIEKVTQAIQMHRAGLTDPNRPIGSFLFLGPTGVGKTEVAKTLAEYLFNDPRKMIRIDMSEYMEKHAVARLIGAPPGYVGYEEGGQLTEQVRRNPYSVILFDEIEKAHPDVFNIFLQILDEGQLTDGQGRTVSLRNCIIIMTSNIGSHIILEADTINEKVRQEVDKLLYAHFRPEFLNRIDAIVFFHRLNEKDVTKIAKIHLLQLEKRMQEQEITLNIAQDVYAKIAQLGYAKEFGARPLKRAIQQHIIVPLSHYILKNPNTKNIKVSLKDKEIVVT